MLGTENLLTGTLLRRWLVLILKTQAQFRFRQTSSTLEYGIMTICPPHFHVIADGWDISFLTEDGTAYRVNKIGKNSSTYTYIEKNVPIWLEMENSANKKITNKEFAELTWDSNHD